jgi:hypothetical protein
MLIIAWPLSVAENRFVQLLGIILTWVAVAGWIAAGCFKPRWWFVLPVALRGLYVWIVMLGALIGFHVWIPTMGH